MVDVVHVPVGHNCRKNTTFYDLGELRAGNSDPYLKYVECLRYSGMTERLGRVGDPKNYLGHGGVCCRGSLLVHSLGTMGE